MKINNEELTCTLKLMGWMPVSQLGLMYFQQGNNDNYVMIMNNEDYIVKIDGVHTCLNKPEEVIETIIRRMETETKNGNEERKRRTETKNGNEERKRRTETKLKSK